MMSKEQLSAGPGMTKFNGGMLKTPGGTVVGLSPLDRDGHTQINTEGEYFDEGDLRELADYLNALATWIEKGGR